MNNMTINKEEFKEQLANNVKSLFRKTVKTASNVELYKALVFTIRSYISVIGLKLMMPMTARAVRLFVIYLWSF